MEKSLYLNYKNKIIRDGYQYEIEMVEKMLQSPCNNKNTFFREYIWVVINSGFRFQIAQIIFQKIIYGLRRNYPLENIFKNKNKIKAIYYVKNNLDDIFENYCNIENKLEFLETLPYVGSITKYHLARNLGIDVCKPDRHLVRISQKFGTTPELLCKDLSNKCGDKIGIVDVVLWRAGNLNYF